MHAGEMDRLLLKILRQQNCKVFYGYSEQNRSRANHVHTKYDFNKDILNKVGTCLISSDYKGEKIYDFR
jgi:hypothetical protein